MVKIIQANQAIKLSHKFFGGEILSLHEKARELGREIRETEEYKELERLGEKLKEDSEAQQLIQNVQEAQKNIEFAQQAGVQPSEDQTQEFNNLREQMQSNITVRSFMKAQEEFNNIMKEVNDSISKGMTNEEEGEKDGETSEE